MGLKINKQKLLNPIQKPEEQKEIPAINIAKSAIESKSQLSQAFSLVFTDGAEYNLDDIIFAKRRDNEKCPLILKVDTNNRDDEEVIKQITCLILDDYGVTYNLEVGPDNESYYKNRVNRVPDFYNVFNIYFNKLYDIYYQNKKKESGTISLSTVLEQIEKSHSDFQEVYDILCGKKPYDAKVIDVANKPQISQDDGTLPDDDIYNEHDYSAIVEKFGLIIDGEELKLQYDYQDIEGASISIRELISKIISASPIEMDVIEDVYGSTGITVGDIHIDEPLFANFGDDDFFDTLEIVNIND